VSEDITFLKINTRSVTHTYKLSREAIMNSM